MVSIIPDVLYFWVDQIEFDMVPPSFDFEHNLDFDNTPSGYCSIYINGAFYDFEYRLIFARWFGKCYQFSISLENKPVVCFTMLYGTDASRVQTWWRIVIHSTFLVVTSNGMLPYSIVDFISNAFPSANYRITRLDIALDVSTPLPKLKSYFDKIPRFHTEMWEDIKYEWYAQTYYTASLKKWKNRYRLFRIYDKVLDSFNKWKTWLFPHLYGNEVRRVELELRERALKSLPYSLFQILSPGSTIITSIFSSHLSQYSTLFERDPNIYTLCARQYSSTVLPDCSKTKNYIDNLQLPPKYVQVFLWYAKKIMNAVWEKQFLQLLRENKVLHTACLMKRSTRKKRMVQDVSYIFNSSPSKL